MTLRNAHDEALSLLERLRERGIHLPRSTGLAGLDDVLGGGYRPGHAVLGGAPGVGKTAFGLQAVLRTAQSGVPGLFFSAEQAPDDLLARALAREIARPVTALLDGDPNALADAFEAVDQLPLHLLYVVGDPRTKTGSVAAIKRLVLQVAEAHGAAPFVVTDYLQRLSPDQRLNNDDLRVAISRVSTALSTVIRDLGITALTISSLNRAAYVKEPSLDVFKESGNIEFDADLAMVLRRHEKSKDALPGSSGEVELWIVKNRFGPVTTAPVPVLFDGRLGSFRSPGLTA